MSKDQENGSQTANRDDLWRNGFAVVALALLAAAVFEPFTPAGDETPVSSAHPSLPDDPELGIRDRILVDKVVYYVREPKRREN